MKRLLAALMLVSPPAIAQVQIENAWARATPPAARIAGGYVTIRNAGTAADRLVGASSPAAARVELHVVSMEGGVMKMRQVNGLPLPAKGVLELKPGAAHLMFVDIKRPFKAGDAVPVTLRFERAGERRVELRVRPLGGGYYK